MIVTAIAAMDRKGLIGDGIKMPWHLPRDLRRFRELTLGKPIIMGRRTLESLRAPLPGRLNIVMSRSHRMSVDGFRVATSVEDALKIAEDHLAGTGGQEVMIVGGGIVYEATCHLWDRLLLTVVQERFSGTTFFPVDQVKEMVWNLVSQECCEPDIKNAYTHWFLNLARRPDTESLEEGFALDAWIKARTMRAEGLPLANC